MTKIILILIHIPIELYKTKSLLHLNKHYIKKFVKNIQRHMRMYRKKERA